MNLSFEGFILDRQDRVRASRYASSRILVYGILFLLLAGLWFVPSLFHLKGQFVPYDENDMAIGLSPKPYVERAIVLYSWEKDVQLTVHALSESSSPIRIIVLNQQSYNNFLEGLSHNVVYDSAPAIEVEFSIPLPFINGKETFYYMLLQNPNSQSISTTYRVSLSYEMAFLGYTLVEWFSRTPMLIIVIAAVLVEAKNRHIGFSDITGQSKHTSELEVDYPKTKSSTPIQRTESVESTETGKANKSAPSQDSLEKLPAFLGEHLVDANRVLGIPLIVKRLDTLVFDVDVNPGTIDIHVYDEPKFVELNGKGYYSLSRSEKIFNASFSATVHSARGLEWTPTKPGKYIFVLDNSLNGIQKRCKLDYNSRQQPPTGIRYI